MQASLDLILSGGDDYEILAAVPPAAVAGFRKGAQNAGIAVTHIGILEAGRPFEVLDLDGTSLDLQHFGYDHFA